MSIRVYSLAKQLKKDNNVIIDVCNKLGIKNKNAKPGADNSVVALSTLSDDAVERIKEFLANEEAPSKNSFRSLMESSSSVPLEPPKQASSSSGKVRRIIVPPRGRITEADPNKRPVVPLVSPVSGAVETASQFEKEPQIEKQETVVPEDSIIRPVESQKDVELACPVDEVKEGLSDSSTFVEVGEAGIETGSFINADGQDTAKCCPLSTEIDEQDQEEQKDSLISKAILPIADSSEVKSSSTAYAAVEDELSRNVTDKSSLTSGSTDNVSSTSVGLVSPKETGIVLPEPKTSDGVDKSHESSATAVSTAHSAHKSIGVVESFSSKVSPPPSDSILRKAPLRQALDNRNGRDSQRRGRENREKDREHRNNRQQEQRPARPAPVSSSFIAQLESRAQVLDEMKRPPMITTQANDRVRVLGVSSSKQKTDAPNQSSTSRSTTKSTLNLHLAPMPVEPSRPIKKVPKEPVAQKPEKRLPPEALRLAAAGGVNAVGPLSDKLRINKTGTGANQTSTNARNDRRNVQPVGGAGKNQLSDRFDRSNSRAGASSGFGPNQGGKSDNRRSNKGGFGREREDSDGREDLRNASRRRPGNESRRLRNGDDETMDFRYSTRTGSRTGRRDKSSSSGGSTMPRKSDVVIETPCTVRQFAETTGLSVSDVIKKLMSLKIMATMNQPLEPEALELLILEFELKATVKQEATLEEQYVDAAFDFVDPPESLVPRAPVVTFLGHVDHGKTSLLDRILHLHVVQGEKGGITQHIRAYRIETPGGPVTFVDTPGHEAFTEMRARGANCTDVAVLVVAADDGVMPQTEEAISHAKAAGVPIVVALNKMDLPGVSRDKVIQELASNDLMPSEWGGDVEVVETSAISGMGVDKLLETLLMVAELHELKANPNRAATGVVLESSLQSGEGVVCKALVQKGTLRNGDVVLCGASYGRVRSMADTLDVHKRVKEAGPGVPVSMTGLDVAPEAGSRFVVLDDIAVARQIAEERAKHAHEIELVGVPAHVTLESLRDRINSAKTQQILNVIIRADVRGSIEAIRKELGKLDHPEVKIKILQASVGGITEADVHLADASDAIIVGFNVVPDEGARALAESKKVQVRRYDVIYKLTEEIRSALEGMLKPVEEVKELGRALVQRAFNISRVGVIAGCRVLYGTIERDCQIRVIRDSRIIGEYKLDTLKREKDDAKEVREGFECGIKLKNFNDVKEGDILEAYKIEEVARTF